MAAQVDEAQRDAFAERLFGAALGAYELMTVHLGDRLGYYRALGESDGLTSAGLAEATGTAERYAREWLEQQAVAGILEVDDAAAAPGERRYSLPAGHAEVLVEKDSLAHVTPLARLGMSFAQTLPAVEEAFRTGGGVPWEEFGHLGREAQGDANRPLFANLLGSEWLPGDRRRPRAPARRPARARRRHRLRRRLVEHRHRARLPERRRRRLRPGRGLGRARPRERRRDGGRRPRRPSTSATRATRSWRAPTSSSPSSRRSTTCPSRSRSCVRCAASPPRTAP